MLFDHSLLRSRIYEKYTSIAAFAAAIERSESFVRNVLNNKSQFTCKDIVRAAAELDLTDNQITPYFFTPAE